ncbi:MAG: tyrosine-protein phosphatase [Nitrospirota bacterium]
MRSPTKTTPWAEISAAGFEYFVCLAEDSPTYTPARLTLLYAVKLQNLVSGRPPNNPVGEGARVRTAARIISEKVLSGHGVVVHCVGGRGRTGTVLGCVLRTLGVCAAEAIDYLDQLHKARGKSGWPESDWQAAFVKDFAS